jgi:hypothetical protein
MGRLRPGSVVALLALGGCCLNVGTGGTGNDEGSTSGGEGVTTGGSTAGGSTTGRGTSGGSTTGTPNFCAGVYCSPGYLCEPTDGICKCGGHACETGNCDADSGACLPGCSDAGQSSVTFVGSLPGEAFPLPTADLGHIYGVQIVAACGSPPYQFQLTSYSAAASPATLGLDFYQSGQLEGVASMGTPGGMPFEFEVTVTDQSTPPKKAYQNFLLTIDPTSP